MDGRAARLTHGGGSAGPGLRGAAGAILTLVGLRKTGRPGVAGAAARAAGLALALSAGLALLRRMRGSRGGGNSELAAVARPVGAAAAAGLVAGLMPVLGPTCAGMAAGPALASIFGVETAVYLAVKAADVGWPRRAAAAAFRRLGPRWLDGHVALHALSTALLMHHAVFAPHLVPESYWSFCLRCTGGRFDEIDRFEMLPLGYDALERYRGRPALMAKLTERHRRLDAETV